MNFKLDGNLLTSYLEVIKKIPDYAEAIILVNSKDEFVYITATTAGSYIEFSIPAEIQEHGEFTVNLDRLVALPFDKNTAITTDASKLHYKCGRLKGEVSLSSYSADKIKAGKPFINNNTAVTLSRELLSKVVDRVGFESAIPSPTHGIHITVKDGKFKCTCNDHSRGVIYKSLVQPTEVDIDFIVRIKSLEIVLNKIKDEQVQLLQDNGIFVLKSKHVTFYYPTIHSVSEFMDVESFFEEMEYETAISNFKFNMKALVSDIKACNTAKAGSLDMLTRLNVSSEDHQLVLSVSSSHGSNTVNHELSEPILSDFNVFVSSKYFIEMLGLLQETECRLYVWSDRIVLESLDKSYRSAMPTLLV